MKRVRKLIPVDSLDLTGLEVWLEEMAARGLHLERLGRSTALFLRGEPAAVRYRLEPLEGVKGRDWAEYDAVLAGDGWELVADEVENTCRLYRTADPNAPEVHTDPVVQSFVLERLVRRQRRGLALSLVLFAAMLVLLVWLQLRRDRGFVLWLVENASPILLFFPLLMVLLVLDLGSSLKQLRRLGQLKDQLAQGFPLQRERTYRRRYLSHATVWLPNLVLFLTFVVQMGSAFSAWYLPLGEARLPFPLPAVTELTEDAALDETPRYTQGFLAEYHNGVHYRWYPLADLYEVDQCITAEEGAVEYHLAARWYDLRLPFLAERLTKDLADDETEHRAKKVTVSGLDRTWTAQIGQYQYLFACAGDKVLSLTWRGDGGAVDLAPIALQILSEQ